MHSLLKTALVAFPLSIAAKAGFGQKLNATVDYINFTSPAMHTQKAGSVGIEFEKPFATKLPTAVKAGFKIPAFGPSDCGIHGMDLSRSPRLDPRGQLHGQVYAGGSVEIPFNENLGIGLDSYADLFMTNDKSYVAATTDVGVQFKKNEFTLFGFVGAVDRKTKLQGSSNFDKDARIPGDIGMYVGVKATINLFNNDCH